MTNATRLIRDTEVSCEARARLQWPISGHCLCLSPTIWAQSASRDILIAFVVFKSCLWTVMLAILRWHWHMSAMCRAAAWAVQCLQIFARTGQGQSATVSDPSPAWPTGAGAGDTDCSLCWCQWWHWDLIVFRSPGYQCRCPLAWLCTFQLYPTSSQAPAPWRVACAWPELVNVRELGQWQRAKWNDITQVAEYFINPPRPQACLCRRQNNFIELGLFFILYDYSPKLIYMIAFNHRILRFSFRMYFFIRGVIMTLCLLLCAAPCPASPSLCCSTVCVCMLPYL